MSTRDETHDWNGGNRNSTCYRAVSPDAGAAMVLFYDEVGWRDRGISCPYRTGG
jgi:hypothetical protein